jgi:xylulokinase
LALPPGADGLLFLPYLAGERSPHMDPAARGAWVGLSLAHDRRHMLRALIEGVGCAFADCLGRMRALGLEPEGLALVGGGARSAAWRRLLATQLGAALASPAAEDGPALGAAILARVGAGLDPNIATAVARAVPPPVEAAVAPDPALAPALSEVYRRYKALYPALKGAGLFG